MLVKSKDVQHCLDQAREVAEQYKLYAPDGSNIHRSVDDLLWICGQYLGKRIDLHEVDLLAQGKSVQAMYWAYDDHYEIYLLAGMEQAWRRFIQCKEIFHVILDHPDCRNMDIYGHLEEVSSTFPVPTAKPNNPAAWEVFAEAAAMEFLYPYAERKPINGDELAAVTAARYGIPESYVENYWSELAMAYFAQFQPT